ncbi:hypothetical protein QWY31_07735 [Cytophagales bacterium LB-30]|uniref:Uncharacterized protein n=1 Tax=Shiella aurantiaca TaxID=3058365 RepID=A0ABT8F4J5_9BACT|nr:hypothetical protein [Shiella aurantiaca]MDN4165388.1 hypothetical protein [Shiella aurantiaca]
METIKIDILNPKAKALLDDLASLDLIRIRQEPSSNFSNLLQKLRSKADSAPSLEDITKEVEAIRKARYEK